MFKEILEGFIFFCVITTSLYLNFFKKSIYRMRSLNFEQKFLDLIYVKLF